MGFGVPAAAGSERTRCVNGIGVNVPSVGTKCPVTAGTVFHRTRTSLTTWFWAAYLMTTDKRGISALLLQRQLGIRRYETAWLILHKLRRAMVNAAREPLHGDVEIDDTWIGGAQPGIRGSRQLKGRKAVIVFVAVEKRADRSGRVRLAVVPDFKQTTMVQFVRANVAPGSTVYTDGLKGWDGVQRRPVGRSGAREICRSFRSTPDHNIWCRPELSGEAGDV